MPKSKRKFECPKCGMDSEFINGYCETRVKVLVDSKGKVLEWLTNSIKNYSLGETIDFECPHCGENLTWCIKE